MQFDDPPERMEAIGYPTFEGILRESYATMNYADMVIDCADGAVPCHRHILAAASPFLRPLLRDYNPIESHRILLPDVTVSTMEHVLSILYAGQTYSPSVDDFREIVEVIKMLGIDFECDLYIQGQDGDSKTWNVSPVSVIYPHSVPELRHQESPIQQLEQQEIVLPVSTLADDASDIDDKLEEEFHASVTETISDPQVLDGDELLNYSEETNFELKTQLSPAGETRKPTLLMTQKPSTVKFHPGLKSQNFQRIYHAEAQRSPLKLKPIPQKKRLHVTTAETADLIKELLQSGQLCLAPGPRFGGQRKSSDRVRNDASTIRNRLVFQNIPQNGVKLPPGNGIPGNGRRNPKIGETLQHLPEIIQEFESCSIDEEAPQIVIDGVAYNSYIELPSVLDSGRLPETGKVFSPAFDPNYEGMEEEEDYKMTPEEILNAAKISSQKDHAYANLGQNQKRRKSKQKFRKWSNVLQKEGNGVFDGGNSHTNLI